MNERKTSKQRDRENYKNESKLVMVKTLIKLWNTKIPSLFYKLMEHMKNEPKLVAVKQKRLKKIIVILLFCYKK